MVLHRIVHLKELWASPAAWPFLAFGGFCSEVEVQGFLWILFFPAHSRTGWWSN